MSKSLIFCIQKTMFELELLILRHRLYIKQADNKKDKNRQKSTLKKLNQMWILCNLECEKHGVKHEVWRDKKLE